MRGDTMQCMASHQAKLLQAEMKNNIITKEVQRLEKPQNNNHQNTNNTEKQTTYWDGVPFFWKCG